MSGERIVIDGSFGEGGGQILRSSLTLAAIMGMPLRVEKIRARRSRPGLRPQHVAAGRAVAEVCAGRLRGAEVGSAELEFDPGEGRPGRYSISVGTAGSTTLIFQTLLPLLAFASAPSSLRLFGGTHNPLAPSAEYLLECYLPAVALIGLCARAELIRHGFAPTGGGELRAEIEPWCAGHPPLSLTEETEWSAPDVTILISNLPDHVAFREQAELAKRLRLNAEKIKIEPLPAELGPGNAILIRCQSAGRTALFTGFGEPGKRAERVAQDVARQVRHFIRSRAAVDPHLADQLLLPLALGPGGTFITSEITEHTRTHAHLLHRFLQLETQFTPLAPDRVEVRVAGLHLPAKRLASKSLPLRQ